ncbi:hypothetical protein PC116_g31261 [Phytophthora cactorum]|nr:hypothetical protein PC116_g31261 [Phytophthora cactorum]
MPIIFRRRQFLFAKFQRQANTADLRGNTAEAVRAHEILRDISGDVVIKARTGDIECCVEL